jgi:tRNA A37 threonylcarbamoyladenosine synthetase subunit TsaC/SUA5/YrdC
MSTKGAQIKIILIDGEELSEAESTIADLVNQGWKIVAAGGGSGMVPVQGFVVLQSGFKA